MHKRKYEWILEGNEMQKIWYTKINTSYIKDNYGYDVETMEEIPTIKYENLKEFFKAIGFNHKTRKYETTSIF